MREEFVVPSVRRLWQTLRFMWTPRGGVMSIVRTEIQDTHTYRWNWLQMGFCWLVWCGCRCSRSNSTSSSSSDSSWYSAGLLELEVVHAPTKPYTSSTRISKSPLAHSGGLLNVWQRSVLPKRMFSSIQMAWPELKVQTQIKQKIRAISCISISI